MADIPSTADLRMRIIEALTNARNVSPDYLLPTAAIVLGYVKYGTLPPRAQDIVNGALAPQPPASGPPRGLNLTTTTEPTWGQN